MPAPDNYFGRIFVAESSHLGWETANAPQVGAVTSGYQK